MSTVTIILNDNSIFKKSPAFIKDQTSLQILERFPQLDKNQYILAVKTPAFIKVLPPDLIPFDKYPQLVVDDSNNSNSIPDFALYVLESSDKNKLFLIFNAIKLNNEEPSFPYYIFRFIPSEYKNKKMTSFKDDLTKNFELQISNPKIFINGIEVPDSETVDNFIKRATKFTSNFAKLEFKFEIESQGLKTIRLRERTIEEILETERTYFLTITLLLNHFGKLFRDQKIVSENDYEQIFGPIPKMIQTSAYLTTELAKQKKYSSCVSQIFSKFLFDFQKTSQEYFVNYNQKTKFMTDKLDSNPQVKKICQQTPGYKEITFQMMAIQPIQRFPRYILLLKELSKHTPKSHPDFSPLCEVNEHLSRIVYDMEQAHLFRGVKSIQERLTKNNSTQEKSIVTQDRILVEEFKVHLRDKKKNNSTLYLFNDLILLTSNTEHDNDKEHEPFKDKEHEANQEQEIMRNEYDKFNFIPNYNDNLTILYYFKEEYKSLEFKNTEEIQKFHNVFNELRNKILENKSQNNLPSIKSIEYFPPKEQIIPTMIDTSCCKIGNLILAISHRTYITYDTLHKSLVIQAEIKNIHDHSKLVMIGGIPYIYGGLKKPGPYELLDNKFEESKPKPRPSTNVYLTLIENINAIQVSAPKEGRIYHTCCAYDKYIVVFGGINPRNRKRHFNDIYFYSVETGEWFCTDPTLKTKPESRYKHSSVVYKNVMIIHGGISCVNDKVLKDTWLFNFLDGKWTMINLKNDRQVVPRFGHSSIIVNRFMLIIGGSTVPSSFYPFRPFESPLNEKELPSDNFPDTDSSDQNSNISAEESENSALTKTIHSLNSVFMSESVAAPDCFCLNIETGKLDSIEIEGNFLHGLSQSSAIYDDKNEQIVIFGGTDPQNRSIKGTPIISTLDIPTHYKSAESNSPDGPVNIDRLISIPSSALLNRKASCHHFSLLDDESPAKDEDDKNQKNKKMKDDDKEIRTIEEPEIGRPRPRRFRRIKPPVTRSLTEEPVKPQSDTPGNKHVLFIEPKPEAEKIDKIEKKSEIESKKSDTEPSQNDIKKHQEELRRRHTDRPKRRIPQNKNTDTNSGDSDQRITHNHHHEDDNLIRRPKNRHPDDEKDYNDEKKDVIERKPKNSSPTKDKHVQNPDCSPKKRRYSHA